MVCAQTTRKLKTHIHTNNPGQVLEIAIKYGQLNIKIENMAFQHKNLLVSEKEIKSDNRYIIKMKIVERWHILLLQIIENQENIILKLEQQGFQLEDKHKNPSVHDIEERLKIQSNKIILLPNNKNIISTAKIVAERSKRYSSIRD